MLKETGYVVAVEPDALWVETLQQSTCGSCSARKGCGQRLLAKVGEQSMRLRVLRSSMDTANHQVNDQVTIGIPENIVVKHSLFIYLLPLLLMIVFSGIAHTFSSNELISVLSGVLGLGLGGLCIRYHSCVYSNDPELQPVLIDKPQAKVTIYN